MGKKATLLLGLGAMIFGGCYNGVEDAGDGGISDRYGKYCYSSYSSSSSSSYKASTSNDDAKSVKTDDGFTLTMKADPASFSNQQTLEVLDQLRFEAVSTGQFFIQTACGDSEPQQLVESCKDTCAQQGLVMDDVVLCDPECKQLEDGTIECSGALPPGAEGALSEPWFGEKEWVFQSGEGITLVMTPPHLEEGPNGLNWVSDVHVTGFCLCACTAG
ncbi:MAG: hypothetical protein ACRBN8_17505 [Nannocystales bacterium]